MHAVIFSEMKLFQNIDKNKHWIIQYCLMLLNVHATKLYLGKETII